MSKELIGLFILAGTITLVIRDLTQSEDPVLRIFPVIGRGRNLLTRAGPKLRQYLIANDREERPFTRLEREWVREVSAGRSGQQAFGGQADEVAGVQRSVLRFSTFAPPEPEAAVPQGSLKIIGEARGREKQFRPGSIVNISGMSFGALSGPAVTALNRGAALAGTFHNTGEGGLTEYHREGADLVFQIGTGYFGCRDGQGRFSLEALRESIGGAPVRALEIKLSQGAKPGLGGFLPGAKVTPEIAKYRGVQPGEDVASPPRHSAFRDVDSMLDWVEYLAAETGLPVGIKSAAGDSQFWQQLANLMEREDRGVDFITVDGGEGGTASAPPVFAELVGHPFMAGFSEVYNNFLTRGLVRDVVFIGGGKLGLPARAAQAFALGADLINVGRTAMIALGCIQALKCHTDDCPTGIATQRAWLTRAIAPDASAERVAHYLSAFRQEMFSVARAVGVAHPGLLDIDHLAAVNGPERQPLLDLAEGLVPE